MAQSKEELLAKARERAAKNRAAKKAVADQGADQAPATPADDIAESSKAENQNDDQVGDSVKSETNIEQSAPSTEDQVETGSHDQGADQAEKSAKTEKVVVTSPFRDKDNFNKVWNVGDDISHFPSDRLNKVFDLKLAEKK